MLASPGHGVGLHEVRGCVEAEAPGGQVVSLARRQVGGSVVYSPDYAVGQQDGQSAVDGRVRLAQDNRQLCRFDKRHPAEGVEQLSVGKGHVSSVATERPGGQPPCVCVGVDQRILMAVPAHGIISS